NLMGGHAAFTNTVPALDLREENGRLQGAIYVSLRNYLPAPAAHDDLGNPLHLRGCPGGTAQGCTGAPGAIAAISAEGGRLLWKAELSRQVAFGTWQSANTSPLLLTTQRKLLVGDVWGRIHAFWMDPQPAGQRAPLPGAPTGELSLLEPGEAPMRARASYSQLAGAGTEPAVASGSRGANQGHTTLLLGVNLADTGLPEPLSGRLLGIPIGPAYNLRWDSPLALDPAPPWRGDTAFQARGQVVLEGTSLRLGDLTCGRPVRIGWWVTPPPGQEGQPRFLGWSAEPLPPDLAPGERVAVASPAGIRLPEGSPDAGQVVGVIDPEGLAAFGSHPAAVSARQLLAAAGTPVSEPEAQGRLCRSGTREAANSLSDNTASAAYQVIRAVDLAVWVEAPPWSERDQFVWVRFGVKNLGPAAVRAQWELVRLLAGWPDMTVSRGTQLPLEPGQEWTGTYRARVSGCGVRYYWRMTAEPLPGVPEAEPSDNAAMAVTQVASCVAGGGGSGGEGKAIIVPADCIPAADPTDPKICQNYDKRVEWP
ncbi:MAG: hypothetical protein RB148_10835, partial [Armatimonadota bacterium]|nr:hypothetical protein [Armatimonadota bacterium]